MTMDEFVLAAAAVALDAPVLIEAKERKEGLSRKYWFSSVLEVTGKKQQLARNRWVGFKKGPARPNCQRVRVIFIG